MASTKNPASRRQGQQQHSSAKSTVASGQPGPRPSASIVKDSPAAKGRSPVRSAPSMSGQGRGAPTAVETKGGRKSGDPKANRGSFQTKRTHWTIEAASRVASAFARSGDGEVKKDSFAAAAMSAAMKNEHKLKGAK
jgi:hypothetical protein